jgi:hypothetical protein
MVITITYMIEIVGSPVSLLKDKPSIQHMPALQREERLRDRQGKCCGSLVGRGIGPIKTTSKKCGPLPIYSLYETEREATI